MVYIHAFVCFSRLRLGTVCVHQFLAGMAQACMHASMQASYTVSSLASLGRIGSISLLLTVVESLHIFIIMLMPGFTKVKLATWLVYSFHVCS